MGIVFDEIEATVVPESAPATPSSGSSEQRGEPQINALQLQRELRRMRERTERLHAD